MKLAGVCCVPNSFVDVPASQGSQGPLSITNRSLLDPENLTQVGLTAMADISSGIVRAACWTPFHPSLQEEEDLVQLGLRLRDTLVVSPL